MNKRFIPFLGKGMVQKKTQNPKWDKEVEHFKKEI